MKNESFKLTLVVIGAVLFNIVFWHEKMAVNAVLFDVFILWSVFYLYPSVFANPVMKWLLIGHSITILAVLIQNTCLSKIAFTVTLLLVVIFSQYLHRSAWYAMGSAFMNYLFVIPSLFTHVQLAKNNRLNLSGLKKSFRVLVIPLLLAFVFFLVYNFANAIFKNLVNDIGTAIEHFLSRFFTWFNWDRTGFLLLGLLVTGGLLLKSRVGYFTEADMKKKNELWRKKNELLKWKKSAWFELLSLLMGKYAGGMMALKNENRTAIVTLFLLNALLLFINCVDIIYVWFGFSYNSDVNLSEYVHEGTGLLIFSILLAILLLLFFFRGNLNFYKHNKWLRMGAYAWLFQNAVLVVSVLFRDYFYIEHFGLAYKRIGVLIFLVLVLIGLITIFVKIQQRKTAFYLLRVNAWVAIVILVVASCVHWDETIARYNLSKKDTIALDVKFLLTLSDKVLPLLQRNQEVLQRNDKSRFNEEGEYLYRSTLTPIQVLQNRTNEFFATQKTYSWLSWNVADANIRTELSSKIQLSTVR